MQQIRQAVLALVRNALPLSLVLVLLLTIASIAGAAGAPNHQRFDQVLQASVTDGNVDYPSILGNANFAQYLQELEPEPMFQNQAEALSYWINAYNALAIKGILDGRSPRTFFGRFGYFKQATYRVGGKTINLYDLERKVIIPLGEPRIHFAINCASQSCPKLQPMVYTATQLEKQLDASTRSFINDTTRNRFDRDQKVAYVSKIFDWFEQDFSQHSGSVQKYLARYVADPEIAKGLANEQYKVKYLKYNWQLNGIAPKAADSEG